MANSGKTHLRTGNLLPPISSPARNFVQIPFTSQTCPQGQKITSHDAVQTGKMPWLNMSTVCESREKKCAELKMLIAGSFFQPLDNFGMFDHLCDFACVFLFWNGEKTQQKKRRNGDKKQLLKMLKTETAKIWATGDHYCCFGFWAIVLHRWIFQVYYIYINIWLKDLASSKWEQGIKGKKNIFFFASISIFLRLKDPSKVKVGQCQNIDLGFVQFLHIETLDQSSLGQSSLGQNNLNQSTLNQSCLGQSSVDQSTLGQGFDQGSLGQSSVSKSTLNQSSWDQTSLGLCAKKEFEAKTWMQF